MNKIIINGSHNRSGKTSELIKQLYPNIPSIILIDHKLEIYNYDEVYSDDDQFLEIINQVINYDEIIFATPVYWYSMSSLMKLFFDRLTDLIGSHQEIGRQLMGKKVTIITTSNGNNLGENFFLPFIETANYLHLDYQHGTHYMNKSS